MKGDNLANQLMNFYNGYSFFTKQNDHHSYTMLEHSYNMLELVTTRAGPVLTPRHHMNNLDRGPLGDATCQISKH